jgi:hypothetical protein
MDTVTAHVETFVTGTATYDGLTPVTVSNLSASLPSGSFFMTHAEVLYSVTAAACSSCTPNAAPGVAAFIVLAADIASTLPAPAAALLSIISMGANLQVSCLAQSPAIHSRFRVIGDTRVSTPSEAIVDGADSAIMTQQAATRDMFTLPGHGLFSTPGNVPNVYLAMVAGAPCKLAYTVRTIWRRQ